MMAFRKLIAAFLAVFLCIGIAGSNNSFSALKGGIKMNVTLMSDAHMEGNNKQNREVFIKCIDSLNASTTPIDALVLCGDNTMNGQNIENLFFYGIINSKSPAKTLITAIGNHDVGNGEGDAMALLKRQSEYASAYVGSPADRAYYTKVVNGYSFIVLGPDAAESNTRTISAEQISWLAGELEKASKSGKPIFVLNHHPYSSVKDGAELEKLITDYENVFFLCGHMHYYTIDRIISGKYDTHEIWIPSIVSSGSEYVSDTQGLGIQMEVYENEIVFRYRDYLRGNWVDLTKTFTLD